MTALAYRDEIARIARRRSDDVPCDAAEIERRFAGLEGASFQDVDVFECFRDVFNLTCQPGATVFRPVRDGCSLDTNLKRITIVGEILTQTGEVVASLRRTLDFRNSIAHHALLIVRPQFRGSGLGALIVAHSMEFYLTTGIRHIVLTAGLTTGAYYWAKLGFQFQDEKEANKVHSWALRLSAKLGLGLELASRRSPREWASLGIDENCLVTLESIAVAFAARRDLIESRAKDMEIAMDLPIHFGKAMLLSSEQWGGVLPVRDGTLALFRNYLLAHKPDARSALVGLASCFAAFSVYGYRRARQP